MMAELGKSSKERMKFIGIFRSLIQTFSALLIGIFTQVFTG